MDREDIVKQFLANDRLIYDDLQKLDLTRLDLSRLSAVRNKIEDVDFSFANLAYSRFTFSEIHDANFSNCNLDGAEFIECIWGNVNFENAILTKSHFFEGNSPLVNANFSGTDCRDINKLSHLISPNFENANLTSITLHRVEGGNFRRAILLGANCSGIVCQNSNFENVNLRNADLSNANLTGSNFRNADLRYANLSNAILSGADLTNANLSHAILINTKFDEAILENTICRDAIRPDKVSKQLASAEIGLSERQRAKLMKVADKTPKIPRLNRSLDASYFEQIELDFFWQDIPNEEFVNTQQEYLRAYQIMVDPIVPYLKTLEIYKCKNPRAGYFDSHPIIYLILGKTLCGDWLGLSIELKESSSIQDWVAENSVSRGRKRKRGRLEDLAITNPFYREVILALEDAIDLARPLFDRASSNKYINLDIEGGAWTINKTKKLTLLKLLIKTNYINIFKYERHLNYTRYPNRRSL